MSMRFVGQWTLDLRGVGLSACDDRPRASWRTLRGTCGIPVDVDFDLTTGQLPLMLRLVLDLLVGQGGWTFLRGAFLAEAYKGPETRHLEVFSGFW